MLQLIKYQLNKTVIRKLCFNNYKISTFQFTIMLLFFHGLVFTNKARKSWPNILFMQHGQVMERMNLKQQTNSALFPSISTNYSKLKRYCTTVLALRISGQRILKICPKVSKNALPKYQVLLSLLFLFHFCKCRIK